MLVGCSDRPSQSQIENLYKEQFSHNHLTPLPFDKIAKFKNFTTINGIKDNDITYHADIAYDLVFRIEYDDMMKLCTSEHSDGNKYDGGKTIFYCREQINQMNYCEGMDLRHFKGNLPVKAGDSCHREDNVVFIKTDNGWMIKN